LLFVALGAALLAGCPRVLPPPPPPEHRGALVRVACPAHLAGLVREQSRAWQARQQARVETVGANAGADADLVVFPPDALAARVARAGPGKLLPLPAALRQRGDAFDWSALLPFYRDQLLLWDRTAYAVPLVGEAPVCLFRADKFADAGVRARFAAWQRKKKRSPVRELRAPLTWDEFARLAEFFQEDPAGGPFSLPPLPADGPALDRLFYTVAASYARRAVRQDEPAGPGYRAELFSFHFDEKTGAPRIAGPGFVAALRVLRRLQACRPAGTHPHREEAFLEGKAVLCVTNAATLSRAQQTARLRDKVGVCVVPGSDRYFTPGGVEKEAKAGVNRVPYLGGAGWLAAVAGGSKNPAAAFDLLADLAGPERSAQIALEPGWGGPTRTEQLSRERWDAFDLDPARSLALKEALGRTLQYHGLKNPVLCLRTPDAAARQAVVVAQLRAALLGPGGDPAKALGEAAARWADMSARQGEAAHVREYRLSLGLLGE
jgi:ABC-type glycerol-3-phosphate transport system substrate-binding protein